MTPEHAPLNELAAEIVAINKANGWEVSTPEDWPDTVAPEIEVNKLGTKLALIHTEVSEAMEAIRHGDRENFGEEIADTIIRCLDLAGGLDIDIHAAVRDKLEVNKGRGFRHGGKAV